MTGDRLRYLRHRAGVSQAVLASALGVVQPRVSHLENQRRITPATAKRILSALRRLRSGELKLVSRLALRQARAILGGNWRRDK